MSDKFFEVFWIRKGSDKKNHPIKVGVMIQKDKGFILKLDVLPTSNWDGWLLIKKKNNQNDGGKHNV